MSWYFDLFMLPTIALYDDESAILEENRCSLHTVDVLPSPDGLKRYTPLLFSMLVFLGQTMNRSVLFILLYLNSKIANWPCLSSLVSLFQNESKYETIHMKMSSICSFIFMQIKVIFIRMVSCLASVWNRDTRKWPDKQSHFPACHITLRRNNVVTFLKWHFYFVSEIVLVLHFTYQQNK